MRTIDKIREKLPPKPPLQESNGRIRCASPLRPDSDSRSFSILYHADGEGGAWYDHAANNGAGAGGSLYRLAELMGIETPRRTTLPRAQTHGAFLGGLEEYAILHGAPPDVFARAGWHETKHLNRPCIAIPTANGTRYRFTDGQSPRWINQQGYSPCWYGLTRAIEMARGVLVLVNGEPSVVVGQHAGIPAVCVTSSGERPIPETLIEQIRNWGGDIWIALDCDAKGREATSALMAQLSPLFPGRVYAVQLGVDEGGDLCDFVMHFGARAFDELRARISRPQAQGVITQQDAIRAYLDGVYGDTPMPSVILPMPIEGLHRLGGFAYAIPAGKIAGVIAPTGAGKSTLLEQIADGWSRMGYHGVIVSPEWAADELIARRVQRATGISAKLYYQWLLYYSDSARGVPEGARMGAKPTDADLDRAMDAAFALKRGGVIDYIEPMGDFDALIDALDAHIIASRANGAPISYVVFDYVQLFKHGEGARHYNPHEPILERIKSFAIRNGIVALVGVQPTKHQAQQERQGNTPTSEGARGVSPDKFNLIIAVKRIYAKDADGETMMTLDARLVVVKNNRGVCGGCPARYNPTLGIFEVNCS